MPELTYREAVRDALSTAMRGDDRIFIMGEDIAQMGGSMGVTQGMLEEFGPTRVRNTPISEVAIVGVNKIETRPLWRNGSFEPRQVLNLSSSFDHRIVDGREAVSFLVRVKECIEDPERLLLDI